MQRHGRPSRQPAFNGREAARGRGVTWHGASSRNLIEGMDIVAATYREPGAPASRNDAARSSRGANAQRRGSTLGKRKVAPVLHNVQNEHTLESFLIGRNASEERLRRHRNAFRNHCAQGKVDKTSRQLHIGYVPPTTEAKLMRHLNTAMRGVNLCGQGEDAIVVCTIRSKEFGPPHLRQINRFAFAEFASEGLASMGLNLDGIPYLEANLKVSRPHRYNGPQESSLTWQQVVAGQPLPTSITPMSGSSVTAVSSRGGKGTRDAGLSSLKVESPS